MTDEAHPLTPMDIWTQHEDAVEVMAETDKLVMSREILAAMIRLMGKHRGVEVSRKDSLLAVFEAESKARAAGAKPQVNFFYPLEGELPLNAL